MNRTVARPLALTLCLAAVGAVALSGCGKPEYCAKRTDFGNSLKTLGKDATTLPPSGQQINTDIQNVQSSWQALNNAAAKDFPTETKNLQSAVDSLAQSAQKLQSGTGTANKQQVAATALTIVGQLGDLNNSWNAFQKATDSKCN
ncbi:MAG: hypothetical protein FGM34_03180 [Solirubrobacteraceae bacterium]|nr:hypothetical protein [Solirubrobacteraceae bacterium]